MENIYYSNTIWATETSLAKAHFLYIDVLAEKSSERSSSRGRQ